MQFKKQTLTVSLLATITLYGCGGSSDDKSTDISPQEIRETIAKSQGDINSTPYEYNFASLDGVYITHRTCHTFGFCSDSENVNNLGLNNKTRRFKTATEVNTPETELIPVFLQGMDANSTNGQRIVSAIKRTEAIIGHTIFQTPKRVDMQFLNNNKEVTPYELYVKSQEADSNKITSYEDLLTADNGQIKSGFFFSFGTLIPVMGKCEGSVASVAQAPYNYSSTGMTVGDDGYFLAEGYAWLNLGVNQPNCNTMNQVNEDIIVHEIAHALGFNNHFDSFGNGGILGEKAKIALKTLYNNPPAIDFERLEIYK